MNGVVGFALPGGWELIIILVVVLLLFGGSRIAGLGKNSGKAIREFKEEIKSVGDGEDVKADSASEAVKATDSKPEVVEAEPVPDRKPDDLR